MSEKSVNWTREQAQVIESRGTNLLVSAAAGSGKTAVLVERIIRMVTDTDHPLDIDRLLVMTFTNAAAAEMRERISAAIEQKLHEQPSDEHLQVQAALVHHAQITTIDSFCLNLIRNHFNLLDLDPSFRIGDEGELTLLKGDVMKELLEDYYGSGNPEYERFVETFSQGKSDAGIEDYIMQVYTFSQSHPSPESWIAACRAELQEEDLAETVPWMDFLLQDVKKQTSELKLQMADALEICTGDEYLSAYAPMFQQDIRLLSELAAAEDYRELSQRLSGVSWARLATVRSKEVDPDKKAYVTGCRDRVKKAVTKLRDLYCFAEPEEAMEDMKRAGASVRMLLELADGFASRYQAKKRERNLVDFNDLEHQALRVLMRDEDGTTVYTEAADELSRQFEEVLVDEYQDSNLVQEALLRAVSRERFGQYNVFMVGDVKQSIYKFRLARPELFLEKYHSYEPYDTASGTCRKIELHQNFRSRDTVLTGINDVFYQIMTENLGNIRYTEDAALHAGAKFPEPEAAACCGKSGESENSELEIDALRGKSGTAENTEPKTAALRVAGRPELLVMDTGAAALSQMDEDAADYTARELEARMIVRRIRELTDPEKGCLVWDKRLHGTGGYRPARYGDIVILLRSTAGWTETLLSVLMNEGIPAYAESRMGYFNTLEVETVLSLLAVIDNPMQDIPLAAVLKSPIVGMTDAELAQMMAAFRACADKGQDRGIYGAVRHCLEGGDGVFAEPDSDDGHIREKLGAFWNLLVSLQQESTYLPIHELLYRVFERTGYYRYVSALPAGETRRANLDMLVEKASVYEQTSYKGLFHFIRYIENLKKYNTDFGEASTVGEDDDTVRIMSIHKSKGLEFPIVFLAGTGKKFNRQDVYGKLLIDPELGIGTDYLDLEHRIRTTTLKKNVLRRKMELDNLGEELRVLYVAMTRAKEKLILTGTDRYLEKSREKYRQLPLVNGQLPYTILSGANSYLDWILMSLSNGTVHMDVTEILVSELVGEELVRQVEHRYSREQLLQLNVNRSYDAAYGELLERRLHARYPHEADIYLHTKMTVSELKKLGQMIDESESAGTAEGGGISAADRVQPVVPGEGKPAVPGEKKLTLPGVDLRAAATRGTAYHRVLELLSFHEITSFDTLKERLQDLLDQRKLTRENYELVNPSVLWSFFQSELGRRMCAAHREGHLHREQQFVMGIPAREMGAGDSDELVVVQGIIDAYVEEDGALLLVDYKTDHVRSPKTLVDRYQSQLEYYARALTQMTGMPVRESVIYSLYLQQAIPIELK